MSKDSVSILVVDSGREVRDLLGVLFQNFQVSLADPSAVVQRELSPLQEESWPDIVVVAQRPPHAPTTLNELLSAPRLLEKVSVVVFPTHTLPLSRHDGTATVCRLQTVSNLLQVIRGLAHKKAPLSRAV